MFYEYVEKKSEVTFVFLHGWGLNGDSFNKIINKLLDASVLKIDLYGFGKSKMPKNYFDTYEYAYQIFLLLKKLNIRNIILVGHSFGGRLAILLSSVFDINILSCVLTSSAGLNRFSLIKWIRVRIYKVKKKICKLRGVELVDKNAGSLDYRNANEQLKRVLIRVVNQDLRMYLSKIKIKTLLVWDKRDRDTPYWMCKKLHKIIEKSKIITFESGGHFTAFYNTNKFAKLLNGVENVTNDKVDDINISK